MKSVNVDFSRGLQGGLVRANLRRASEELLVGDEVLAIDSAEDMEFTGTVRRIEDGFAYLEMNWEDSAPVREFNVQFRVSPNVFLSYRAGERDSATRRLSLHEGFQPAIWFISAANFFSGKSPFQDQLVFPAGWTGDETSDDGAGVRSLATQKLMA
ncbi:hypothetical protein ACAG24_026585 [Mycobacterium sp. pW049]|uniref:hypothetical protein n=1 Tax=[Mycobacterium] bulgaricum TaxID=3238985 RepID=UPI00351BC50F